MLLSRVADALYWISRYLERAEHTARLIEVRLDQGLDREPASDGWDFQRLYAALRVAEGQRPTSATALVDALVFDPTSRNSVMACVTAARENARQVREEISSDMWEQVNAMFLRLSQMRLEGSWSGRPHYVSRTVIEGIHLFEGITDATMGHGEGWQFLQAGRFLERASETAALLELHFREPSAMLPAAHVQWGGLLRSCSALEAYCRCYTADLRPERIAEFLLLNAEFPRSVRFAAARLESAVQAIAQRTGRGAGARSVRLAGRLRASLDYGQIDEILSDGPQPYLQGIVRHCVQIHGALYQQFISYPIEAALTA